MRDFVAFSLALILAGMAPAFAADEGKPSNVSVEPAAKNPKERLNQLFGELKRERNEKAAERIAGRIGQQWFNSGSATIDLLMQWSQKAMDEKKFGASLDYLDQVTMLSPDYVEGWNRRATVHFLMNNYAKSMADIERTLELEPRHFGALSGLAKIMQSTGRKELALEAYQRVLDVYPMMRDAQREVGTLSEELAGEGI
jgi:tetratricopeptide (TPR) repeat protein